MQENIIEFDHVTKEYRLGAIGGGTLKGDLQSLAARIRGKEDPNLQIGQTAHTKNQRFLALDDVSFSVKKGERVGIIGHNGAGKSTLLKLLSRVTAPTKGTISYNGRIASMLEVGTGFHPELTGRENVYMNGAILGMTKAEISRKFDDIVRFAEMEQFIDTPVKRYSSGMYVKLAFAVAAHLDSDILVMDEVLAVGDMKFQQKCLGKMDDVSKNEGRTVLYVSHNMNTIRQLCTRCIVLDHGKVVFDGDVEQAVSIYFGRNCVAQLVNECENAAREPIGDGSMHIHSLELMNMCEPILYDNETLCIKIKFASKKNYEKVAFRVIFYDVSRVPIGMAASNPILTVREGENEACFKIYLPVLAQGEYTGRIVLYEVNEFGNEAIHDVVDSAFMIRKDFRNIINETASRWNRQVWGSIVFPTIDLREDM
ncbi:MAG: polysaccharide ABC transporter ATP-binding protein [Eubacteriales bacterium]|nr:polysaccharide ABC transporter ATP-binding protein [Eubacteriales bacterium]